MFIKNILKKKNESSSDYVYRVIKQNILELYLKPGELVSENEVSNILQLSRTPIREAFIRLSQEKFLDIVPKKGTFVSLVDFKLVEESLFLRINMEKKVLELACKSFPENKLKLLEDNVNLQRALKDLPGNSIPLFNLDNKFHSIIFEGCEKSNIWKMIEELDAHYNRLRTMDALEHISTDKIIEEHEKMIEAIREKNVEMAFKLVDDHLTNFLPKLNYFKEKHPDFFK
jgi:DNA-binding GntR family transcriptional regulator